MKLSGWGRFPTLDCRTAWLGATEEIGPVLSRLPSLIARGNGRAYGDAALNPDATLLMGKCDRLLEFDAATGVIECEAGLLLSDLLDFTVPHGWFSPVVPGTKLVTIGGLIAADVHGKNHHVDGSFGSHVESLRLALADGNVMTCSPSQNPEVFAATLGGMGLTGVVLSARIRLRRIASDHVVETIVRTSSFADTLHQLEEHRTATYSVAWIDCLAAGRNAGRGVLLLGEHSETGAGQRRRSRKLSIPVDLPAYTLNGWSIRLFNELYYRLHKPAQRITDYDRFFFPLDGVENWNRLYGRRGFVQHQSVIGGPAAGDALHEILSFVQKSGQGSFLAVLKKLGPGNRYLSFPKEGYTITLDFARNAGTEATLAVLDSIVAQAGGRIYLAKDARAPRAIIEQGYPEIDAFRTLRRKLDPERRLRSALSERLGL